MDSGVAMGSGSGAPTSWLVSPCVLGHWGGVLVVGDIGTLVSMSAISRVG
jgi:hypothetical protein